MDSVYEALVGGGHGEDGGIDDTFAGRGRFGG